MKRLKQGVIAACAAMLLFCGLSADEVAETRLVAGVNGSASPAGGRIAFQKRFGQYVRLGLYDIAAASLTWLEEGEVCAAFPSWSPDGSTILYALGDRSHTAYENWISPGLAEGYRLRTWRDGVKTDILRHGRWYDCSPSFAPDGRTIWYCSNNWIEGDANDDYFGNRLWRATLGEPESGRCIYDPKVSSAAGVSQPVVSPNGEVVCWAELTDFSQSWGLMVSRTDGEFRGVRITPTRMSAYSPNWSPDGRYLAFTACGVTDTCWSVYLMDPRLGRIRRVCAGENPSFLREGAGLSLVFDRDRYLWKRPLTESDYPREGDEMPVYEDGFKPWTVAPTTLFSLASSSAEGLNTNVTDVAGLAFDATSTTWWKVRFDWAGGTDDCQTLMQMMYKEHNLGSMVYLRFDKGLGFSGNPHYSTRQNDAAKTQAYVYSKTPLTEKGVHTVVGIRADSHLWISVDGAQVSGEGTYLAGLIPLDTPRKLAIGGASLSEGTRVLAVEIGTGWPADVPMPTPADISGFDWGAVK